MPKPRLDIAILHPILGIGGAERLILQAARALLQAGHTVTLYTNTFDPTYTLPEALELSPHIKQIGHRLPTQILGHLRLPCAYIRMAWLVHVLAKRRLTPDLFISDLLPHITPRVQRLFPKSKTLLYCHFPDQLLTPKLSGWYSWYRRPWHTLEAQSFQQAHGLLTNSCFTKQALLNVYAHISEKDVHVVYPGVAMPSLSDEASFLNGRNTVLSIGRFMPQKNHRLALEAFAQLNRRVPEVYSRFRLVLAGGYDDSLAEARTTLGDLERTVDQLGLAARVDILLNPSDAQLEDQWKRCCVLLYPPRQEHLGIVPLEAMARSIPVIAVNQGGPLETIRNGEVGFLCPPKPSAFADALASLLQNQEVAAEMGRRGRIHVEQSFSEAAFAQAFVQATERLYV